MASPTTAIPPAGRARSLRHREIPFGRFARPGVAPKRHVSSGSSEKCRRAILLRRRLLRELHAALSYTPGFSLAIRPVSVRNYGTWLIEVARSHKYRLVMSRQLPFLSNWYGVSHSKNLLAQAGCIREKRKLTPFSDILRFLVGDPAREPSFATHSTRCVYSSPQSNAKTWRTSNA